MNYDRIISCLKMLIMLEEQAVIKWHDAGLDEEFGSPTALYFIGEAQAAVAEIRRARDAAKN